MSTAYPQLSLLVKSRNFVVKVKVDSAGRRGKIVTVLDGLPKNELFLKELLKIFKTSCGAGGTVILDKKDGGLELQGDHRDKVCKILETCEIQYKRS